MKTPKRPYFIRALHEWMEDNQLTTYIMVDATHADLVAPTEYAQDGILTLAISYMATKDLMIDNDGISFNGRFGGVAQNVWIPMQAVLGIRAKEEQEHTVFFDPSEYDGYDNIQAKKTTEKPTTMQDTPTKPTLKIIK